LHAELLRLAEHDPTYAQAAELTDAAAIQLAEAASLIERARDGIDLDPDRLQELEAELARLHELSRRHRVPLERLASVRDTLAAERESLRDAGGDAERLQAERDAAAAEWRAAAKALAIAREAAARKLGDAVTALMAELGMAGGMMQVDLSPIAATEPTPQGTEQVEFLVSANPGQPPRALRKVASGGELSRIALAIEVAALGMDAVPTMVFDEVDSGIGGAVAEVVGRKLRVLGAERQVLCVTHLPQVAAQAHHHVRVSKDSDGTTTRSAVRQLDEPARVDELARMLGGIEITRETRANAKQMLLKAQAD
jgi:DNA repair protein RecN (Recombination protein N)